MSTQIFAHRGSSRRFPENTMIAFKQAFEEGADGIELDVHLTQEGTPIVIHDESINRTTNGSGNVKDMSLSEIKQYSAGVRKGVSFINEKIPTLEEVFEWLCQTPLLINIELKNNVNAYEGMEEKVIELVNQYEIHERVIYSSFNHQSMKLVKTLDPSTQTALLYEHPIPLVWEYAKAYNANGLHPKYTLINPSKVFNMHLHKLAVRPYTINNGVLMKQFIRWNVDSLITDIPAKAVEIRETFN